MRRKMHISKTGLKLIKAYEGYRPVDRHLVNGHHVVGYGHIIEGDDSLVLTRPEAEDLLRSDLEPYEDMINETVHAPLSQSQYDALVSLAFNIGPRAFTESDTLRALNNGRPLDAASGFDIWRKSTIDGKTYVVDALMRRRAAEKALFLRTEGKKTLPASRADLPPVKDEMVALLTTEDALPVITNDPRNGMVARVPYQVEEIAEIGPETGPEEAEATPEDTPPEDTSSYVTVAAPEAKITQDEVDLTYARRREDGPSGILELSEVYEEGIERVRKAGIDDDLVDATYEVDDFDYEDIEIETKPDFLTSAAEVLDADKPVDSSDMPLEQGSSLIAETATEISERLDALIDNVADDKSTSKTDNWPETMLKAGEMADVPKVGRPDTDVADTGLQNPDASIDADNIAELEQTSITADEKPADIVIDNLVEDDAFRERTDSASKYIKIEPPQTSEPTQEGRGYFIPLLIGCLLFGASSGAIFGNPTDILGEWGPLLSFVGLVMSVIMIISTLYYAVKTEKTL